MDCVGAGGFAAGGAATVGGGIGWVVVVGLVLGPVARPAGRGASFHVFLYKNMNKTEIADNTGTASSAPTRPNACSPRNSEKITSTGWIFAAVPMILGLSRLASMKWIPMIQSVIATPRNTSMPSSPETRATITIGTDDKIDPKIGIRLIRLATTARIRPYFTPNTSRPT